MQQRYYDPVIGRFYSNDPVGFTGEPDTFNRYSYVANNPYKYTDPFGATKESSYEQCERDPNCQNIIPRRNEDNDKSVPALWSKEPDNNGTPSQGGVHCDTTCINMANVLDAYLDSQETTASYMLDAGTFFIASELLIGQKIIKLVRHSRFDYGISIKFGSNNARFDIGRLPSTGKHAERIHPRLRGKYMPHWHHRGRGGIRRHRPYESVPDVIK